MAKIIDSRPRCERCAHKGIDNPALTLFGPCWVCGPCTLELNAVELNEKREKIIRG